MQDYEEGVIREVKLHLAIHKYKQAESVREIMGDRATLENQVSAYIDLKRTILNKI